MIGDIRREMTYYIEKYNVQPNVILLSEKSHNKLLTELAGRYLSTDDFVALSLSINLQKMLGMSVIIAKELDKEFVLCRR